VAGKTLRCMIVTPECAVLDEVADSVILPLFDGDSGVLPGREPLIDGGFVQVVRDTVTILTPRALLAEQIDQSAAQKVLEAPSQPSTSSSAMADRLVATTRARAQLKVARSR